MVDVRKVLKDIYVEWWNDYITVETMADHQGLKDEDMNFLIDLGKRLYKGEYKI